MVRKQNAQNINVIFYYKKKKILLNFVNKNTLFARCVRAYQSVITVTTARIFTEHSKDIGVENNGQLFFI